MSFYQKIIANKYDSFMENMEVSLFELRNELIGSLEGTILDVGSGTGVNYEHFDCKANVISIEPSKYMLAKAIEKIPKDKNITTYNLGVNDEQLDSIIEEESLDSIVCTLVLCTIPNPEQALKRMYSWLKPEGKLIILEHIHSEKSLQKGFQNLVNPIWKKVADGCNLNRSTDVLIQEAGFLAEKDEYFKKGLRFYSGVFTKN